MISTHTLHLALVYCRCPEILNAEPGCNYITDPRDPTCCRIPDCTPVNPNNPEPHPIPPKTYQGQMVGTPGKPEVFAFL